MSSLGLSTWLSFPSTHWALLWECPASTPSQKNLLCFLPIPIYPSSFLPWITIHLGSLEFSLNQENSGERYHTLGTLLLKQLLSTLHLPCPLACQHLNLQQFNKHLVSSLDCSNVNSMDPLLIIPFPPSCSYCASYK